MSVRPKDCWTHQALFDVIHMPQDKIAKHADTEFCWSKRNDIAYLEEFIETTQRDLMICPDFIKQRWNNCSIGNIAYLASICSRQANLRERMQSLYVDVIKKLLKMNSGGRIMEAD